MKTTKGIVLLIALLAIALSVSPLLGGPRDPHNEPGGGGGSGSWNVTCVYDGQDHLISKTCTSGGSHSCDCE